MDDLSSLESGVGETDFGRAKIKQKNGPALAERKRTYKKGQEEAGP